MTVKELHINQCVMYANFFAEHGKERGYGLLAIKSVVDVLHFTYLNFIKDGVPKISDLDNESKKRFWELSAKHQSEHEIRIKASKAAYVLSLITNE